MKKQFFFSILKLILFEFQDFEVLRNIQILDLSSLKSNHFITPASRVERFFQDFVSKLWILFIKTLTNNLILFYQLQKNDRNSFYRFSCFEKFPN